mmetsp:Transcript_2722/g.7989  ORF Transcript_2722/g.7989 Transcript_2722/m.7989 type:complete len:233 (+) Transcript_2722:133-831(+)
MAMTSTIERCRKKCSFYQQRFSDIPPLSSEEYVSALRRADRPSMVLIDARSSAERSTSIIPGAIALAEFEQNIATTLSPDASVVVYCTIGYRSGMEARRLKEKHGLDGRIRNLDGIVSYTHAIGDMSDESVQLIKPDTGETTNIVHIFGRTWDCVHLSFETVHFNAPELALRSTQVGLVSTLRFTQHLHYKTRQCCNCMGYGEQSRQAIGSNAEGPASNKPMDVRCRNAQFM